MENAFVWPDSEVWLICRFNVVPSITTGKDGTLEQDM